MLTSHPYHMVTPSPWPLVGAMGALGITSGLALWFHGFLYGDLLLFFGILLVLLTMFVWWRDVIRESTYQGFHTSLVQRGLRYGILLFILSEVAFFFSFFWAFFHSALSPVVELGCEWPPMGIEPLDPWSVPFLNTAILLSSGASVTWAHHSLLGSNNRWVLQGLLLTVLLGILFTSLQAIEYYEAPFSIADSVYGSTFYVATGFHGLHVIIGTLFLSVTFFRALSSQLSPIHHFGFEAAAWYWHFVDVVWLFLFVSIYWWGS